MDTPETEEVALEGSEEAIRTENGPAHLCAPSIQESPPENNETADETIQAGKNADTLAAEEEGLVDSAVAAAFAAANLIQQTMNEEENVDSVPKDPPEAAAMQQTTTEDTNHEADRILNFDNPVEPDGSLVAKMAAEAAATAVAESVAVDTETLDLHQASHIDGTAVVPQIIAHGNFEMTIALIEHGTSPHSTLAIGSSPSDLPVPNEDEIDMSTFPYEVRLGKDVISGKGGKVQQVNRHFRNLVAADFPQYDSTSSKISKRRIGLKIYQEIIDKGGRFLDHSGNVMDQPKAVLKVMKALKDAKTWTSDAKRQAKRRREAGTAPKDPKVTLPAGDDTLEPAAKRARIIAEIAESTAAAVAAVGEETPAGPADPTAVKEENDEQDGNGLALLYQAIDV